MAASHICSLSGLATNERSRTSGTSLASHFSWAAINHSTSACGQCTTARVKIASAVVDGGLGGTTGVAENERSGRAEEDQGQPGVGLHESCGQIG